MMEKPATPATVAPVQESEGGADLRSFLATLLDAWQVIALALVATALAGLYFAWSYPPIYTAVTLVEVSSKSSGYVLGQESLANAPGYWGPSSTIQNQIELIKSRSILSEAVEQTALDLSVQPRLFPEIGSAWTRHHSGSGLAPVPLDIPQLDKYAWGGEKITITDFQIPGELRGQSFRLVAGTRGSYDLYAGDTVVIANGTVGETMQGKTAEGIDVRLNVGEMLAHKGTEFFLSRQALPSAAEALRGQLSIKERGGSSVYGGSGILEIRVDAGNPAAAMRAANAIATAYLKSNVRNLSEEATKKLEFLNQQIPRLQASVATADEALLQQKLRSGNLQLSEASKSLLTDVVDLEKRLSELELQRVELAQTYTAEHPAMVGVQRKREALLAERDALTRRMNGMPSAELKLLQLARDSQVANQLYVLLLNKAQEIRLVQAGTVGTVRIVDDALLPGGPSGPDRTGIFIKWLFVGFVLGATLGFIKKQISITANTPDELEQKLGVPIYATIPHSGAELAIWRKRGAGKVAAAGGTKLLAINDPTDPAIESIRSLRASMFFALTDSRSNLVVISGPAPDVGKSFVASNLAIIAASAGQRVLLVDCDLRRGHLHESFKLKRSPGLSEYLSQQAELKEVVHYPNPMLGVLTTGRIPPNPAELLASNRFSVLLEATRQHFDIVIADSPPVMNLADAVLVGRHAGAVFVVVRGGRSSLGEVRDALKRFAANNINVDGLVFNDFKPQMSGYLRGGYGKYYYYEQKYKRYI